MPPSLAQPVSFVSLALALLVASLCRESRADCGGPHSACVSAETLWIDPFPGPSLGVSLPSQRPEGLHLGATLGFAHESLIAVAAAPDPYGNEIPVLDDWWTSQLFLSAPVAGLGPALGAALDLGLVLPISWGASGHGLPGVTTRTGHGSVAGIGDPRLSLRFARELAGWHVGVTQEVTLPLGQEQTFLHTRSVGYAPKLGLEWRDVRWSWAFELGARLRRASPFVPVRFGSEALFASHASFGVTEHTQLAIEAWALPSLTRDEFTFPERRVAIRRVPSELSLAVAQRLWDLTGLLAIGTSLPLSSQEDDGATSTVSGPPGPTLRLHLQIEGTLR